MFFFEVKDSKRHGERTKVLEIADYTGVFEGKTKIKNTQK